jgi:hypothetical protein
MDRVIAEQMSQLLWITEIVDANYFNVRSASDNTSHHHPTNATKTVDSNLDSHIHILPQKLLLFRPSPDDFYLLNSNDASLHRLHCFGLS